ncbi:MAG: oxidoreductase [Chloroflexi bacterium]|nr:oxidoreductase [Chloroflexota bacterium]
MDLSLPDRFSLEGKSAIITGGAGLLGIEHARALLEIGAQICIADLSKSKIEEALLKLGKNQPRLYGVELDVTCENSITQALDWAESEFGGVDILINNASLNPKVTGNGLDAAARVEDFTVEQWNKEIEVGLTGAFLCSKHFGKMMSEKDGGVILNIASDLSVISPDQRIYREIDVPEGAQKVKPVTYSVIKTGLIGLTRYFSTYWASKGVRVNALSPGGVFDDQDESFVKRLTSLIPAERMAKKEEYRGAIQFLCSDASAYMNGQNIVIDGGRTVW